MRYCARDFMPAEIEIIRSLLAQSPPLNRYRLSQAVCAQLNWRCPDGYRKARLVAVECLHPT
jgi:hypothetical protein